MDQGETIEASGEYTTHQIYGKQFKIEHYTIVPPSDEESVERYLASGAVKGVGQALAKRIVKAFGEDTYRIIEEEPERLAEVKGISLKKPERLQPLFTKSGMPETPSHSCRVTASATRWRCASTRLMVWDFMAL